MTSKYLTYRGAIYKRVAAEDLESEQMDFMVHALGPISDAMDQMLNAFLQSGDQMERGDPAFLPTLRQFGKYSKAISDLVDKLVAEDGQANKLKALMEQK